MYYIDLLWSQPSWKLQCSPTVIIVCLELRYPVYTLIKQALTGPICIAAYGIVNMDYCKQAHRVAHTNATDKEQLSQGKNNKCSEYNCAVPIDTKVVCGIRKFGPGFKVRLFLNECEMMKYNCEKNFTFEGTDIYVCDGMPLPRVPHRNLVPKKLNLTLDNTQAFNDMAFLGLNDTEAKENINQIAPSINNVVENLILTTDADLRATPMNVVANETIEINEVFTEDEENQTFDSETLSTEAEETTQSAGITEFVEPETMNYDDTLDTNKESKETTSIAESVTTKKIKTEKQRKNLVIVDATLFDINGNINDTIDNFFAATHIFDLPLKQVGMGKWVGVYTAVFILS